MTKTILLTFLATISAISLAATLFLNSTLGAFGMVATSIDTLQNLKASQQVVERMKRHHSSTKNKATRRFAKRPIKRIGTATIAAATLGTVAVAVTITGLEAADYCEEKRGLQEQENILYGTQIQFDYKQCFEEGKNELTDMMYEVKDSTIATISNAWTETAQYSSETWASIKNTSIHALESTGHASSGLWDAAISWIDD